MIFAFLDPAAAKKKGEELLERMNTAKRVHVISTRYRRDEAMQKQDEGKEYWEQSCDPFRSAHCAKEALEHADGVFVFDPNGDNAFLMKGDSNAANAIWLLNWLAALERAQETGGRVVQVVVPPGLSHMQEAEATMAKAWGVPVVKLDCSEVKRAAGAWDLEKMAGWAELEALNP